MNPSRARRAADRAPLSPQHVLERYVPITQSFCLTPTSSRRGADGVADHSFNLDVNALVGKVLTISAKRKTISAESIQFKKCLFGNCKRFPSSRLPSLGCLLSRMPCDSPWVFPDRPNFHVKQTCDPVSNQRRFPNSGGQLQVKVGSGQRCLCGA